MLVDVYMGGCLFDRIGASYKSFQIVSCANVLTKNIVIFPENGIFKHVLTRRNLVGGGESLHHASYGGEKTGLRDHLKALLLASLYAMHDVPVLQLSDTHPQLILTTYSIIQFPGIIMLVATLALLLIGATSCANMMLIRNFAFLLKVSTGTVRSSLETYFAVLHPVALPLLICCIEESAKMCVRTPWTLGRSSPTVLAALNGRGLETLLA